MAVQLVVLAPLGAGKIGIPVDAQLRFRLIGMEAEGLLEDLVEVGNRQLVGAPRDGPAEPLLRLEAGEDHQH